MISPPPLDQPKESLAQDVSVCWEPYQPTSTAVGVGTIIRIRDEEIVYLDLKSGARPISDLAATGPSNAEPTFPDLCAEELRKLESGLASSDVVSSAFRWSGKIGKYVNHPLLKEANIALAADGEPVMEWWYGAKKLTLYSGKDAAEFVKVWGADVDHEMEDGVITSGLEFSKLWQWLTT